MSRRSSLLALLALALPATASAQSLLNAAGLGVPADPVDARARSLGGVGLGLEGAALLGSDPAAAAGFVLPTIFLTAQPSWVDFGRGDTEEAGRFRGTRFPSMGVAYPTWRGFVVTLSVESFLDQRYQAEHALTLDLGEGPVDTRDEFVSEGGVSQVRLGIARAVGPNVQVGLSAGRYGGSSTRRLVRAFGAGDDSTTTPTTTVEPYRAESFWTYAGAALTGGASVTLGGVARVAGSLTWSSALDATPAEDTPSDARAFHLPLQLRVGASAVLAPGLSVSAGLTSADWSAVDGDLREGTSAGTTTSYGAGVELARARVLGRSAPLRLGYRRSELPFALGAGTPTETVWAGGLGLNLSQAGEIVRAAVDLALERGDRVDTVLSESFWRATLTVRVAGF